MRAGDRQARIVRREVRLADLGIGHGFDQPLDFLVSEAGMVATEEIDGLGITCAPCGKQAFCLFVIGGKRRGEGDLLQLHAERLSRQAGG
ncbi:MAG: hypothetical protein JOY90_10415 [Bradyrhizobium sp.]|nr:hypothetical protein [Bradyrhizobium sp.]